MSAGLPSCIQLNATVVAVPITEFKIVGASVGICSFNYNDNSFYPSTIFNLPSSGRFMSYIPMCRVLRIFPASGITHV